MHKLVCQCEPRRVRICDYICFGKPLLLTYLDLTATHKINSASIVRCHSLECIAAYYNIEWLDSRSNSNIRNSAKKMGDKTTWQSQTRVYIEHCHWLGSCSCRVILFGVRKLLPHSRRYLMLLKPDRVDILETVKWIALCQIWTIVENDFVCV